MGMIPIITRNGNGNHSHFLSIIGARPRCLLGRHGARGRWVVELLEHGAPLFARYSKGCDVLRILHSSSYVITCSVICDSLGVTYASKVEPNDGELCLKDRALSRCSVAQSRRRMMVNYCSKIGVE